MVQYKDYAFGRLTEKTPAAFHRESISDYLSAFSNDLNTVETDCLKAQFEIVVHLIILAGATLMMLWYSPIIVPIMAETTTLSVSNRSWISAPVLREKKICRLAAEAANKL